MTDAVRGAPASRDPERFGPEGLPDAGPVMPDHELAGAQPSPDGKRVGAQPPLGRKRVGAQSLPDRKRVGIMGGTFDPIHHGHLVAASEVMHEFALDEVVFVPTATQPFKVDRQSAPAEDRYLMTVIATASNNRFTVSRVDIDRGGVTYTYETLRDLSKQYPEADWFFITGADALHDILSWKNAEEVLERAHFIGVSRPGHLLEALEGLPNGSVTLVEVPAMAISSTDIRNRVREGKPIWYLVPDGVVQYISKHGLYR